MYSEQDLKELLAPYEARIAELEEQCNELKQSRIRLKQETDAFVQARIKELERALVTCRIRCERAEKRLAQELRKRVTPESKP